MFLYFLNIRGVLSGMALLGLMPALVFASAVTILQKSPTPGKEAFYAENPKDPQQKILLVPSDHLLNLRFVEAKIVEAIKASDVLISEAAVFKNYPELMSWDAPTMVAQMFKTSYPFEKLKQFDLLREKPFVLADAPWTHALSPATRDFLIQNFQPSLPKELPLDNLNPVIVYYMLDHMTNLEERRFGMDVQAERDFALKGKVLLELESAEESIGTVEDRNLIRAAETPINRNLTDLLDETVVLFRDINSQAPMKKLEKTLESIARLIAASEGRVKSYEIIKGFLKSHPEMYDTFFERRPEFKEIFESMTGTAQRTKLWIPVLLKYLSENKGKSIAVMVGANHFHGSDGLVKLLTDQGFKITTFNLS